MTWIARSPDRTFLKSFALTRLYTGDDSADAGHDSADTGDDSADTGDDSADTGDDSADAGDASVNTGDDSADAGYDGADTGDDWADTGDDRADTGDDSTDTDPSLVQVCRVRGQPGRLDATVIVSFETAEDGLRCLRDRALITKVSSR